MKMLEFTLSLEAWVQHSKHWPQRGGTALVFLLHAGLASLVESFGLVCLIHSSAAVLRH